MINEHVLWLYLLAKGPWASLGTLELLSPPCKMGINSRADLTGLLEYSYKENLETEPRRRQAPHCSLSFTIAPYVFHVSGARQRV